MKQMNKTLLLNLLYRDGPLSRIDLARRTRLSPTTVSVLIEEAMREGIVHETGTGETETGRGRKLKLLGIRADYGYFLGVDLSKSRVLIVMLNLRGDIVARERYGPLVGTNRIEQQLPRMILQFAASHRIEYRLLKWVGVSVQGWVDEHHEKVIASYSLNLHDMPLKAKLEQALQLPVHLVNDIDAAGFAERYNGAAKELRTIVYLLIGYGCGAGLVINHQIFRGTRGEAGRTVELQQYSTDVLAERLRGMDAGKWSGIDDDEEVVSSFVDRALQGNEPYAALLEQIIEDVSKYCGILLQFLNPQQLIINGWISHHALLLERLIARIQRYESAPDGPTPIQAAYWRDEGAAVGAATLGLYQMFNMHKEE